MTGCALEISDELLDGNGADDDDGAVEGLDSAAERRSISRRHYKVDRCTYFFLSFLSLNCLFVPNAQRRPCLSYIQSDSARSWDHQDTPAGHLLTIRAPVMET